MSWSELYADHKAKAVTLNFVLASVVLGVTTSHNPWPALIIFHAILILNTYFSIYRFALVTPPQDAIQKISDLALAALYLILACLFDRPAEYLLVSIEIFFLAILKWLHLASLSGWTHLLMRKVRIDLLGFLACLAAFWGIQFGYTSLTLMIWSAAFGLANIYLLFFRPMYRTNT